MKSVLIGTLFAFMLSGCAPGEQDKDLCAFWGTCKKTEDCHVKGTCGSTQLLSDPDPLLAPTQLLPTGQLLP
jgi:hypothetical protein